MYTVKVKSAFSSAHRLEFYRGKCEKLHGHNWIVEVEVGGRVLDKSGMLYDFTKIKKILSSITESLDHKFLNEIEYFKKVNPTSENIAKYIYLMMKKKIRGNGLKILRINIWESETSMAGYIPYNNLPE